MAQSVKPESDKQRQPASREQDSQGKSTGLDSAISDLENEDENQDVDLDADDDPGADPNEGDPDEPGVDVDDDDLPDQDAVQRYLEKNGFVAFRREDIERSQQQQQQQQEQRPPEQKKPDADIDDALELADLQFTDPTEYQRRIVAKATRAFGEGATLRDQIIEELRTEIPEMDEEDLAVVRKNLVDLEPDQLKAIHATRSHIASGKAYAYDKRAAGITTVTPKKNPTKDKKITTRPERKPETEPSVSGDKAAAAEKIAKGLAKRGIKIDAAKLAGGRQ